MLHVLPLPPQETNKDLKSQFLQVCLLLKKGLKEQSKEANKNIEKCKEKSFAISEQYQ